MAKAMFKVEGMDELIKNMKKLKKVPQRYITNAAKKGMQIVLNEAVENAPEDTGALKEGIISVKEKPYKSRGKSAYRLVFDRDMNDIFQKKNADGEVTGYYPVSQEHGYFTQNGKYIPGFMFTHEALAEKVGEFEKTIVDTMKKKIDAEISKGGLRK